MHDDLRMVVSGAEGSVHCQWAINGREITPEDPSCLPEGNFRKGDTVQIKVSSADGTAIDSVTIGNAPPEVMRVPFEEAGIHQGMDIRVIPDGVDPDDDPVSFRYRWKINGEELSWIEGSFLSADRFKKGDRISLTVIPFDGETEGKPYHGKEFVVPNAPPRFVTQPPSQFSSQIYTYQALAEDPDDVHLAYRLEGAPEGMTIDSQTGEIKWPIASKDAGSHMVWIVAEDEEGMQAIQEYSVEIAIRQERRF